MHRLLASAIMQWSALLQQSCHTRLAHKSVESTASTTPALRRQQVVASLHPRQLPACHLQTVSRPGVLRSARCQQWPSEACLRRCRSRARYATLDTVQFVLYHSHSSGAYTWSVHRKSVKVAATTAAAAAALASPDPQGSNQTVSGKECKPHEPSMAMQRPLHHMWLQLQRSSR